jgi:Zn-dependent protease with chaperone function
VKPENVEGYVEWLRDGYLIADGQRIAWNAQTRLKLGRIKEVSAVPLGYEVKARGIRHPDGSLLAQELEVKPNGVALYENEVLRSFDAVETLWLRSGVMFDTDQRGRREDVGRILESGEHVERVRTIMARLTPAYVTPNRLRVRVVDSGIWNAAAMANGAIWVFRGLLEDVSDDELAIVLGHELAHYTYEHSRRGAKQAMWRQLAAVGVGAALDAVDNATTRDALTTVAQLSLTAWKNGYGRNLEDQADRVSLRYAFEGGFDVSSGPGMWARSRDRSGELDAVSNFLFGSHSRPSDRIKNIERELDLNYRNNSNR